MKRSFKNLLKKFCLESSILGLKYFYLYPDPLTRCFWGLVMVMNVWLACLLTWLLYHRFAEMPTRITIENQYMPIRDLPHPAVTICSPNQITISSMKHFNRTLIDGQSLNLERVMPQLLGFFQFVTDDMETDDLRSLQTLIELNRYTAIEVIAAMAQPCDKFLKRCFFHGQLFPCQELFKPILTVHGLCCIFNSIYRFNKRNERITEFEPRLASRTGMPNALTVVVDYDPADAIDATIVSAGATRVMVTDWTEFPADDESCLISAHTEAFNLIHATYTYCSEDVHALPTGSRKCYFEHEKSLPYFGHYRNSDCDLLCFASQVKRLCGCSLLYLPHLRISEACNFSSISCIIGAKRQMSKWYNTEACDCPRDCEARHYRLELSVGNLGALPHVTVNPYGDLAFTKSTSILHLFIPASVYVEKKQETVMSLISLASNLGGVFGLCLGCSVISVLEVLFFLYVLARNQLRRRLRRAGLP